MKNILTFDIEEWYHVNYPNAEIRDEDRRKSNLEWQVEEILRICNHVHTKATFFVVGEIAERRPHLVRMIHKEGHEIASHGYTHSLVYRLSPKEFKEDLRKSIVILESITGEKILGYRAPSWSITREAFWAYPCMVNMGLLYSASVFPIQTFLYGVPDAPRFPYFMEEKNQKRILEIPASTFRWGSKNIPFSGGFFFRVLPEWLICKGIRRVNEEGHPAILYLHPREIDASCHPKLKLSWKEYFIHYWGVAQTKEKLNRTLQKFSFGSIKSELLSHYVHGS